jgi:hypothetical protein
MWGRVKYKHTKRLLKRGGVEAVPVFFENVNE